MLKIFVKAKQKMKNKTLQNEKNETLQQYRPNIYQIYSYLQKEWLDLQNTWTKSLAPVTKTLMTIFQQPFPNKCTGT